MTFQTFKKVYSSVHHAQGQLLLEFCRMTRFQISCCVCMQWLGMPHHVVSCTAAHSSTPPMTRHSTCLNCTSSGSRFQGALVTPSNDTPFNISTIPIQDPGFKFPWQVHASDKQHPFLATTTTHHRIGGFASHFSRTSTDTSSLQ